jgi:hypothetical protein
MAGGFLVALLMVILPAEWMSSAAVHVRLEAWRCEQDNATASAMGHASTSGASARPEPRIRPWPCLLVVRPTLLGVIEDAWQRSPTFRRQCEELAEAGAVVFLAWGTTDSQSQAVTRLRLDEKGVVVAHVVVQPVRHAMELVAHELEHVIEKIEGVDFTVQSARRGSGVWRAHGGFETRRAIDAGKRVAQELQESSRAR